MGPFSALTLVGTRPTMAIGTSMTLVSGVGGSFLPTKPGLVE